MINDKTIKQLKIKSDELRKKINEFYEESENYFNSFKSDDYYEADNSLENMKSIIMNLHKDMTIFEKNVLNKIDI